MYRPRPSSRRGVDGGAPGRLALEYHGGHENETMREPISMEQVLEAMNCREAARGLSNSRANGTRDAKRFDSGT